MMTPDILSRPVDGIDWFVSFGWGLEACPSVQHCSLTPSVEHVRCYCNPAFGRFCSVGHIFTLAASNRKWQSIGSMSFICLSIPSCIHLNSRSSTRLPVPHRHLPALTWQAYLLQLVIWMPTHSCFLLLLFGPCRSNSVTRLHH